MVEYLVMHLKNRFKVATLSRGYKRKTKGYALANPSTTAIDIGDVRPALGTMVGYTGKPSPAKYITFSVERLSMESGETVGQ